jgi:predicted site-specific integrase-resolvase
MARVKKYVIPEEVSASDLKDQYYTPRELSGLLNISIGTLAGYRRKGVGPKYIAFSYHTYRYAKADVLKYLEERKRTSTSATQNYDL